ncbi:carbohydrate porin [Sphaerotilus microaerophilus]|uniref:Maltoporin n=1 Tax=Sphaerotilus microaerophilus TaxID=2914710 RepID=A0ABM7YH32_9BURK|nr:carbohydrate porin [Sphaerotilus sp. FB-5]BDI03500.1 maltoporin [Sphaerotilus sp. FB-5]
MTQKIKTALQLTAVATLLAAGSAAQAVDFGGYFRGGPQTQSKNEKARECYGLGGVKYRLGNECDIGGEFMFSQGFKTDGIDSRANLMIDSWSDGATPNSTNKTGIAILSGEFTGFDIAPSATFFAGKVRERRGDVHIIDTFFTDMSGVGAGFKGLSLGGAKLGVGFYRADTSANQAGSRFNVEVQDIALGGDNKLGLIGTFVSGKDTTGGENGSAFSVKFDSKFAGLSNTVWAQYATGSAGLNSNFGNIADGSAAKRWRLVETINGQSGALGGQAVVLFGSAKDNAGVKTDTASVGGRLSYGVTKNFKLVGEAGFTRTKTDGAAAANLTKVTIAPTLSTGPDFWTRPELRFYVTSAKWNDAAKSSVGITDKTSGTSYGAQVEWWF